MELPRVFKGVIDYNLHNNKEVFDGRCDNSDRNVNVEREIDKIFASKDFVYKKNVVILLKDGSIQGELVGRDGIRIILMDGRKILIKDILDIKKDE